jgi:transposase
MLVEFMHQAEAAHDLRAWKRAKGVLGYIEGKSVIDIAEDLDVVRGTVNQWLRWYERAGVDGLRSRKAPGPAPRLSESQRAELTAIIEAGPQEAGLTSGMWTGPMIADVIRSRFNVGYHNQYVPRLLHALGFSVQRPRKRLARADTEAQATWLNERLPTIKKKRLHAAAR